jgi:hypothetical protein
MQIRKSDDLDNACAKSLVLQILLAQAFAMQIISTLEFSGVGNAPAFSTSAAMTG